VTSPKGFEDAYVLSSLRGRTESTEHTRDVFLAYDTVRRLRTQRLVATSRSAGEVYELVHDDIGDDLAKVKENLKNRHEWIWTENLPREKDLVVLRSQE
jgi:salicylate hydroxylase